MNEKRKPIEKREEFFQLNKDRLERMAFNALQRGMSPDEFVVVAIDVDDPSWSEVVDLLMPNADWQQVRDRGEKPVARGSVKSEITEYIGMVVPDIVPALTSELPQGVVRGIVMASGGASVYYVSPDPHAELN